jgi:hypothetical protein
MLEAAADRKQDTEKWQKDITTETTDGDMGLVIRLHNRIHEGQTNDRGLGILDIKPRLREDSGAAKRFNFMIASK